MAGDAGAAAFDAAAYDQKIAELVRRRRAKEKRESQQRRRRRQRRRLSLSFLAAPAPPSPPLRPLQRPRDCHQGHALSRGCGIRTNEARYRAKPEPAAASFFSFFLFIRRRTDAHAENPSNQSISPFSLPLSFSTERRGRRRVLLRVGGDSRVLRPDGPPREPAPRHLRGELGQKEILMTNVERKEKKVDAENIVSAAGRERRARPGAAALALFRVAFSQLLRALSFLPLLPMSCSRCVLHPERLRKRRDEEERA